MKSNLFNRQIEVQAFVLKRQIDEFMYDYDPISEHTNNFNSLVRKFRENGIQFTNREVILKLLNTLLSNYKTLVDIVKITSNMEDVE